MDITEDLACSLTEKAAELGAELFVFDDGWFKGRNSTASGLGDWEPDPIKFPNGLNKIIKAVNDKGMKFGLWLEPEMVSPDSDLYRTHPDWIINFPTREREVSRRQLTLNLAREDVLEFCFSTIDNLLGKYNIEYLKIDMNRPISQPGWPEEKIENQQKFTLQV